MVAPESLARAVCAMCHGNHETAACPHTGCGTCLAYRGECDGVDYDDGTFAARHPQVSAVEWERRVEARDGASPAPPRSGT